MNIRIAEEKDLKSIVQVYNQAVAAGYQTADTDPVTTEDRKEWYLNHVPDKYPIFVAEYEKKIVGWLSLSAYRLGRQALRYTSEVSYYIDLDFQRKGIGSRLLLEAINLCPTLKIKTLFAILIENNLGSIKLLENHGFEKWGYMPKVADFGGIEVGHLYYGLRIKKR